ncbi:MAG: J domain-containing protein, partial [Planctomycetia bacterium]
RKGSDVYCDGPVGVAEAILGGSIDVPTLDGATTITVPPGTSSGQKLRLRGKGGPTPESRGQERGDLYVVVKIVVPKSIDDESRRLIEQFAKRNPKPER